MEIKKFNNDLDKSKIRNIYTLSGNGELNKTQEFEIKDKKIVI